MAAILGDEVGPEPIHDQRLQDRQLGPELTRRWRQNSSAKPVFLGYEFRPRLAKNRHGKHFVSFLPAVSTEAMKAMGREIRSWHWAKRSDKSLGDLALMFNNVVQGWINYYGRFYRSRLLYFLRRLNDHLVRWACRKYDKRLRNRERRAMELLAGAARRSPRLFAHWRLGVTASSH